MRGDYLSIVQQHCGRGDYELTSDILLHTCSKEREYVEKLIPNEKERSYIVVCPGSAWRNKKMPLDSLELFLKKISEKMNAFFVFVWGTEEEREEVTILHKAFSSYSAVSKKMSVPGLQNLMGKADFVISMDSLPLHVCGTTATPSFGIFGPSLALKYAPGPFFQGECPYGITFIKRCPQLRTCKTGACIREASPEEIMAAFIAQKVPLK